MCNKHLLDWNCGAEMLKMVVKLIFFAFFFAVPLFLPIFAIANKTMVVHPGEQRLLLGHQGRAFFMPGKNARRFSQKKILAVAIP